MNDTTDIQGIWRALDKVKDPEIPVVSVVDMGIVRSVEREADRVTVNITPTFSGCPALHVMREDIKAKLLALGFTSVTVQTVLSPAWTTDWLSDDAKEKLRAYGVTPPEPVGSGLVQLELSPARCPRCDSLDTTTQNTFGPTLCKSIHTCNSCKEPFEAFKSL